MWRCAILLLTICLWACLAQGQTTISYSTGTGIVYDPATALPGTAFTLDYTSALAGQSAQPVSILLGFDCHVPYSALKIQLASDPTVFSFPPTDPSVNQTAAFLYDPAWAYGGGNVPASVMPDAWRNEMSDGLLQGRFWIEGTSMAPQYAFLSATGSYLTPEPATLSLVFAGGMALLRRKNRH